MARAGVAKRGIDPTALTVSEDILPKDVPIYRGILFCFGYVILAINLIVEGGMLRFLA